MKKIYDLYVENLRKGNFQLGRSSNRCVKKWTEDEIKQLIIDYANYVPMKILEIKYGRKHKTIKDKAYRLNLTRKQLVYKASKLLYTQKQMIDMYIYGFSSLQIAKLSGCGKAYILKVLRKHNIKRRNCGYAKSYSAHREALVTQLLSVQNK